METMNNPIKIVNLYTCDTQAGDDTGETVDMQQGPGFETMLGLVSIGAITGTPTSVKVSFVESDTNDFASTSVVSGGAEVTVAADSQYSFQLKRTKRYIRMVLDFTGGTTPSAEVAAMGVLTNWAVPMNVR